MKSLVRFANICVLSLLAITNTTIASESNEKASAFELPHLTSGIMTSLSDYKGKVVYVDFWASWCKPCKKSFPVLNEFHNKYKQQGFEVIAINLDEDKLNALAFLQQHKVDYSVLYDEDAKVAQQYKVQAMPSAYFIDKKGIIRLVHKGYMDSDKTKIKQVIELLINE
ncbi:TlpA family protein disulfide reductase [Psychrosphaera sp. F3M07]|uniref:TlpA disulfide reductase family protein n=1 Tax=Psychrosphaera sp. F3M07 TaxID=2841560 RepID=UPI001C09D6AA|nr:TlpA disulfide reductase family protein [Psychrosphaera sp. F3M07]MBU2918184.1 TlpA family protein disulfide reductase [Psychrosphaera sp. F3M07]